MYTVGAGEWVEVSIDPKPRRQPQLGKMMAGPSIIDQVVSGLIGYAPEKVILFGSAARGETDEFSDIDRYQRVIHALRDRDEEESSYLARQITSVGEHRIARIIEAPEGQQEHTEEA